MPLFDAHSCVIGTMAVAAPVARMAPALQALLRSALRVKALRPPRVKGCFPLRDCGWRRGGRTNPTDRALILDFGGVILGMLFETHDLTEVALGLLHGRLT